MIEHARNYREQGLTIIPLVRGEKLPPRGCTWKHLQTEQMSEEEFREKWKNWPDSNIGMVAGRVSGVFVVETDGEEADEWIKLNGGFPPCPQAISGSGRGHHFYFRYPGYDVPSHDARADDKPLPLEIKSDGSLVVLPPSLHKSGREYEWTIGPEEENPPYPPVWLETYIKGYSGNGRRSDRPSNPAGWTEKALDGVKEGSRKTTAVKLGGHYLRNHSLEETKQILLMWNEKNQPPLKEHELEDVFHSLSKYAGHDQIKELGKQKARKDISVDSLIPYESFIRNYVDFHSDLTDAPKVYHLMMAYYTLGVCLGDRIYMELAGHGLYPNLWVVLIGGSSLFRKTTALSMSKRMVGRVERKLILPSDFTTEKLLEILEGQPQGGFYHSEFKSLYGLLSKDYMSGAKALLTELYDCPGSYIRETKGKSYEIKQPVLSLAGATTVEWLTGNGRSGDDFGSGFLPRFLFVPAFKRERSLPFPPKMDMKRYNDLNGGLSDILGRYRNPVEIEYTPEATRAYEEWYRQYDALNPFADTPLTPFHARYQTYVHKLAMLLAASRKQGSISLEAVSLATQTIEYITQNLVVLYDKYLPLNYRDSEAKKVLALLPEDGQWIKRRDVMRMLKIDVKRMEEIERTLVAMEHMEKTTLKVKNQDSIVYRRVLGEL